MLPHTLAVFAVERTRLYCCYVLRPIYVWHQEVRRTGGMERNEAQPPVSLLVVYIPCSKYIYIYMKSTYTRGAPSRWANARLCSLHARNAGNVLYVLQLKKRPWNAAVLPTGIFVCKKREHTGIRCSEPRNKFAIRRTMTYSGSKQQQLEHQQYGNTLPGTPQQQGIYE